MMAIQLPFIAVVNQLDCRFATSGHTVKSCSINERWEQALIALTGRCSSCSAATQAVERRLLGRERAAVRPSGPDTLRLSS